MDTDSSLPESGLAICGVRLEAGFDGSHGIGRIFGSSCVPGSVWSRGYLP